MSVMMGQTNSPFVAKLFKMQELINAGVQVNINDLDCFETDGLRLMAKELDHHSELMRKLKTR
jgi:hypothetical protein